MFYSSDILILTDFPWLAYIDMNGSELSFRQLSEDCIIHATRFRLDAATFGYFIITNTYGEFISERNLLKSGTSLSLPNVRFDIYNLFPFFTFPFY